MRALVALAVLGACSAFTHQAYNPIPAYPSYGYQPKWTGPLASSIPAGVNGLIIPVEDTYEVSAAKNAFFAAYNKQLAAVAGGRYGSVHAPVYHSAPAPHAPTYLPAIPAPHVPAYAPAVPSYNAISVYNALPKDHVQDTPEVAAAKAQFFHLYNKQAAAAAAAPDDPIGYNTYH